MSDRQADTLQDWRMGMYLAMILSVFFGVALLSLYAVLYL